MAYFAFTGRLKALMAVARLNTAAYDKVPVSGKPTS